MVDSKDGVVSLPFSLLGEWPALVESMLLQVLVKADSAWGLVDIVFGVGNFLRVTNLVSLGLPDGVSVGHGIVMCLVGL